MLPRLVSSLVLAFALGHHASGVQAAEPKEIPILPVQAEVVAPPFVDGDEITLWCAGDQEGSRFLDAADDGQVKLARTSDAANSGTHWRVKAHADGTVSFRCLGTGLGENRWLNGLTEMEEARTVLTEFIGPETTGTLWKVYSLGNGEFALRCQGNLAGVRWLNGYTPGGSVSLVPETVGKFTGTHWKFQVVAGGFPARMASGAEVADGCQLSIWNQHNGDYRDRGTDAYQVEAFHAGASVWKSPELRLAWSPINDPQAKLDLPVPRSGLDEIRIYILKWIGHGGGLAEVALSQGGHDLTDQCKVSASGVFQEDPRFTARCLVDKTTSSEAIYVGYWLLPDDQPGFVRILLPPP